MVIINNHAVSLSKLEWPSHYCMLNSKYAWSHSRVHRWGYKGYGMLGTV